MLFEELLVNDKTFTLHHQNIQSLALEMHNSKIFVKNNHNYNLCSRSVLAVPRINTVFKDQNSISYSGSVVWISILAELK